MNPEKEAELFTMLEHLLEMGVAQGQELERHGEILNQHTPRLSSATLRFLKSTVRCIMPILRISRRLESRSTPLKDSLPSCCIG